MMKMKIFNMMMAAAAIILLGSCSTDDSMSNTDTETGRTMKISVAQAGFTGSDSTGTRATNDGVTTTFESGDHVGIYVTDGSGTVVTENQEITYNGTKWVTGDGTGDTEATLEYHSAYHYFAYYPYNSDLSQSKLTLDATTGEAFFKTYIDDFTPSADQSTAAQYSAQDLMVATGAAGETSLSFGMTHQMALVEMDFAQIEYWQSTGTSTGESGLKYRFDSYAPYNIGDGQYRVLVNPTKSVGFTGTSYSDLNASPKTWTITAATHTKSALKKYKLGSTLPSFYTCVPAVGSLYNSDGTCTNKIVDGKTPIGVVVSITPDYCENKDEKGNSTSYGHGLVMALKNVSTDAMWCSNSAKSDISNLADVLTVAKWYNDNSGLKNCNVVKAISGYSDTTYPAFYLALNSTVSTPSSSSGWFLPSSGQWYKALEETYTYYNNNHSGSTVSMTLSSQKESTATIDYTFNGESAAGVAVLNYALSGHSLTSSLYDTYATSTSYWTSSEYSIVSACYLYFGSSSLGLNYRTKANDSCVRPFLAF